MTKTPLVPSASSAVTVATAGLVAVLTVTVPIRFSPAAKADDFAPCINGDSPCAADSTTHDYCWANSMDSQPDLKQNVNWARGRLEDDTIINTVPNGSTANTCLTGTDMRFVQGGGLSDTTLGWAPCTWAHPTRSRVCNAFDVVINLSSHTWYRDHRTGGSDGIAEAGEIGLNLDISACHEIGHTVGLEHHNTTDAFFGNHGNDCMVNQWVEPEDADEGWKRYNRHHRDHVNGWNY